ncbi:MAG: TIGR02302 family protein [Rhodospirillales bacterium]|nr:TIGR02302 family protein [Rhodospirillales bacterium]
MRAEDSAPESAPDSPARRFSTLVALARWVVSWEGLWPALWPAAALAAAFLGLAGTDTLPLLPEWAHGLLLVGVAALLAGLLRRAFVAARLASESAGRARIERDSRLAHRPLTAVADRLAAGRDDPAAQILWAAHQARAGREMAQGLSLKAPAPGVAARDRWALRAAALLALAVGLLAGHDDYGRRLGRALSPGIAATDPAALALEAWITPPAYTRRAPIFLTREWDGSAPAVPAGSAVLVQATGLGDGLELAVGGAKRPFAPIASIDVQPGAKPSSRAETAIEAGDAIVVAKGRLELWRWPIRVIPDAPPEIVFTAAPSAAFGARLRIDFEASDDYGLSAAHAIVRRAETKDEDEIRIPLQIGPATRASNDAVAEPKITVKGTSLHDLSAHPWAGTPVTVRLEATDARGQTGVSDAVPAVLPERFFNHPVARALAEQRKRLLDPSPSTIEDVVMELERISGRPAHFAHDTVVYLALRMAIGRLVHDGTPGAVDTVRRILWETALRVEDGKFVAAGRDLRDLQERLARALREGQGLTPEAERLLDEIKRALDKLFEALARDMAEGDAEPVPFDPETMQMVDSADLYRMLEEARELMRMGQMDAARELLAELQRMLQGLQRGLASRPQGGEAQKGARMMNDLREMSRRQQQLLDRSFRRSRDGAEGQRGQRGQGQKGKGQAGKGQPGDGSAEGDARADARAQNALRRMLGEMMRQMDSMLGRIPEGLGNAERAMRRAEGALDGGDSAGAIGPQTDALQALQDAIQGIGNEMARRFGADPGQIGQMPQGERGINRDPFGREPRGAMGASAGGDVQVPDRGERLRAREILDELRRRAGERDRPMLERDYIDRLLKMF